MAVVSLKTPYFPVRMAPSGVSAEITPSQADEAMAPIGAPSSEAVVIINESAEWGLCAVTARGMIPYAGPDTVIPASDLYLGIVGPSVTVLSFNCNLAPGAVLVGPCNNGDPALSAFVYLDILQLINNEDDDSQTTV